MLFKASSEYNKFLIPLINSITKELIENFPLLKIQHKSSLLSKLILGKITYDNYYFKGYFTNQIEKELQQLGATKSSRGYYLPYDRLPNNLKKTIQNNIKNQNKFKQSLIEYLDNEFTISLSQTSYIISFITSFSKHLTRNFKKPITQEVLKQQYTTSIINGINETIKKTKEYLLNQDFISNSQLISKTTQLLNTYIKDKVLNETNRIMFETQMQECKEDGYNYFYWWHPVEKKPSDRQYHRRHFEDSKKGKKFYFNNLPIWNGEPDYPGKLWNCRCRAYVFRDEFLKHC